MISEINIKDSTNYTFYLVSKNFSTNEVVVEGVNTDYSTRTLSIMEISKNDNISIAKVLEGESAFSVRSMGASTSRPVFRGMNNNRLKIIENEIESGDMSASSYDHTAMINTGNIHGIKIISGTDLLEYSGNVGSAALKIDYDCADCGKFTKPAFDGAVDYSSNNNMIGFSGKFNQPVNSFTIGLNYSTQNAEDAASSLKTIQNSAVFKQNAGFDLIYNSEKLNLSGGTKFQKTDYGVPGGFIGAHPNGADIKINKQDYYFNGKINLDNKLFENLSFNLIRTYYEHREFEKNDVLGAEFIQTMYSAKLDINKSGNNIYGKFGLNLNYRDFRVGAYVFTPYIRSYEAGLYYLNKVDFDNFSVKFGLRYDLADYSPYRYTNLEYQPAERFFNGLSAGISANNKNNHSNYYINIGKSYRSPAIEEIYSQGPHLASYTYEKGNNNLNAESSYFLELGYLYNDDGNQFSFKIYNNYYPDFITFRNSGDTNWAQFLPVYKADNLNANLIGFETEILKFITNNFYLKSNLSGTFGLNITENGYLPEMPPISGTTFLNLSTSDFEFRISSRYSFAQNNTDKFEKPTEGFIIFGAGVSYNYFNDDLIHSVSFSIDNIFNQLYYNHLSKLRVIYPEQGINIRLNYRLKY